MPFQDQPAYRVITTDRHQDVSVETLNPPVSATDTIKIAHCTDIDLANKRIFNYGEDCIDMVGAAGARILNCELHPKGRCGIMAKGQTEWCDFEELSFASHGRDCDIELGNFDNYWYPGRPPTRYMAFHGKGMLDGSKVKFKLYDADLPLVGFGCEFKRVPKWQWFPYFLARYIHLKAINLYRKITKKAQIDTSCYKPGTLQPC